MGHEQIKDILERQLWLLSDRAGNCNEHDLPGLTSAMLDLAYVLLKLDKRYPSVTEGGQIAERNGGAV